MSTVTKKDIELTLTSVQVMADGLVMFGIDLKSRLEVFWIECGIGDEPC